MFLTPEQLPFYGGTYFPPEPRHGMPAWTQVLQAIAESWNENAARRSAPAASACASSCPAARGSTPSSEPLDARTRSTRR